jgi:NDP-sugar pyrophosphorylase family protein
MGTRMNALGAVLPKCLLPVYDQPLLLRQIAQCMAAGVRHIIISIADKFGDLVDASLRLSIVPPGVFVRCVRETAPLGAQRGLTELASEVRGQACLVVLGDAYFARQAPFDQLYEMGVRREQLVIGITPRSLPQRIACNVVLDDEGRIVRIVDRPLREKISGDTRWACLCALQAGVLDIAADLLDRGRVPGPHLGDLLEALRAEGVTTGTLLVPELEQNVNTVDELLIGTLLEARRAAGTDLVRTRALENAMAPLLVELGLTLADVV